MSNRCHLIALLASVTAWSGCYLPEEDRARRDGAVGAATPDLAAGDGPIDAAQDAPVAPSDAPAETAHPEAGGGTGDAPPDVVADLGSERLSDAPDDRPEPDLAVDGTPDGPPADVAADVAASSCSPRELKITDGAPGCQQEEADDAGIKRCPNVTCVRNPDGTLLMTYSISATNAWASCEFSSSEDLAQFDIAYEGGKGIIEVVFCIESGSLEAHALNLWYGRHPLEKMLALARPGAMLPGQCYVRYFSPMQARFPGWTVPRSCRDCGDAGGDPDGGGADEMCEGRCGAGTATCPDDFRKAIESYKISADGGPSNLDYDLKTTRLRLTAEWGSGAGIVRLRSIKHLTGACLCGEDSDCRVGDRLKCWQASPLDCAPWPPGPGGVCGPRELGCTGPPGEGTPCTVTGGGKTCQSAIQCVDGKYVCPFTCR